MVQIKNENILMYLQSKFNKSYLDITEEDLNQVEVLTISKDSRNHFDLKEALMFHSLKELTIEKRVLTEEDIDTINSIDGLEVIEFVECAFENETSLGKLNVKSMSLVKCFTRSYDGLNKIKGMENLFVISPYDETSFDLDTIKNQNGLKLLVLEGIDIKNTQVLENLKELGYISFQGSVVEQSDFNKLIPNLPKLFKLIVPKDIYDSIDKDKFQNINIRTNVKDEMLENL